MKIRGVLLFLIFFMLILISVVSYQLLAPSTALEESSARNKLSNPTPTPLPFVELTIPYLREKNYESKLEDRTLLSNNGTYTSYLTSYDSDGLTINGLLTVPAGDEPENGWPAIVFIHGYIPPRQYQTNGQQYADYVDYLARNGFVVFKIDLRGHADSEGEPGGAYYSADYVVDALNAYAALQKADFVNPQGIGLWGHSMAGNVVMRSMAAKPEIPAIVIWAGAVYTYEDMQEYGIQDSSYVRPPSGAPSANRRQRLTERIGQPDLSKPFWQQMAPVTYFNDFKGAIQIHHAVNDDVVSVEYSRNVKKLLEETSVSHEIVEYPTGGHNLSGISFVLAMDSTVAFFKKNLQ